MTVSTRVYLKTLKDGSFLRTFIRRQMDAAKRPLNDDGKFGGNNTAKAYERHMLALSETGRIKDHMERMLLLQQQGKLGPYLALSNIGARVQAQANLLPPSAEEC